MAALWPPFDLSMVSMEFLDRLLPFKPFNASLTLLLGAYLSEFVKRYVWVFVLAAVILAVRPAARYFGDDEGK